MTDKRIDPKLVAELLKGYQRPEDLLGPEGLLKQLTKSLVETALGAELTHHLGYAKGEAKPAGQANQRNGTTPKTLLTEQGEVPIEVPRDRAGTFEPQLVPKGDRRLSGLDDKIISMYARGMTVRPTSPRLQ